MRNIDLDILEKFKRREFDYNNDKKFNEREYFRRFNDLRSRFVHEDKSEDPFRNEIVFSYILNDGGYNYLLELRRLYHWFIFLNYIFIIKL